MNSSNRTAIEERIEILRTMRGREFGPDVVIEDARDSESPLHDEFPWDVEKAAMEHWREIARDIIHSVQVFQTTEKMQIAVPRYVRNPDAKPNEQSYVSTAELRTDHDRAWQALSYEIERADAMIRRAQRVALAVGLENEVEFVATAIASVKSKMKKSA